MDKTFKNLITKYLNDTYDITLNSLDKYNAIYKYTDKIVPITDVYDDIKVIFNLHPITCGDLFHEWINTAAINLNNELVDDLYDTYSDIRTSPMPSLPPIKSNMNNAIKLRGIHQKNNMLSEIGRLPENIYNG